MVGKNPYYGRCVYLKWRYAKKFSLSNTYSKVRAMCKKYGVDVYTIHRADDLPMCCISISPYTRKNCPFFKDKNNQTQLGDF